MPALFVCDIAGVSKFGEDFGISYSQFRMQFARKRVEYTRSDRLQQDATATPIVCHLNMLSLAVTHIAEKKTSPQSPHLPLNPIITLRAFKLYDLNVNTRE